MKTVEMSVIAGDTAPKVMNPLRFAVFFDELVLQEWQARCLRALLERGRARLELVIVGQPAMEGAGSMPRPGRTLFPVFRRLFVHPTATRPVDPADLFATVPVVSLGSDADRPSGLRQPVAGEDPWKILEQDLDFILHFGSFPVPEVFLEAARYGVWEFHQGDDERYHAGPPGFWEIHDGEPVTGAVLRRRTGRPDERVVLKKGFFPTVDYSWAANMDRALLESASWPAEVCDDIRQDCISDVLAPPMRTTAPVRDLPNNRQTLRFVQKVSGNIAIRAGNRLFRRTEWNIGIVHQPVDRFLQQSGTGLKVDWLPALSDHGFVADPFGIEKDGRIHLFFEEYDRRLGKGVISHVELDGGAVVSPIRRVLDLPVHLSYPYVFEHDGRVYCLPETSEAREIALYQAVNFPHEWRKAAVLVDGIAAADATVFEFGGRWWLFCTDVDAGENLRLFIWHAPALFGPWRPHAANPVKTDIRSSRPAGRPFTRDGVLFRPAQDCSRTYGGGIKLNRVTRLTPGEFAEEAVTVIQPDPTGDYPDGIHTLSEAGGLTFVDGKRLVFRGMPRKQWVRRLTTAVRFIRRPRRPTAHQVGSVSLRPRGNPS
ncbi:glucosamine inositolphosphorylceramide transferase family protein [Nitrolancea hollandica]|uniref:Glucosamine inositolphosphorylceramide transferase 1 N-terminal domain-containing protein n=1 Tax=Nitrolancea hollandica Lb TaxID=1129897 RepID=I4EDW9_9BACT|nr:hypothetical protein [Nitrolancea hollandica]CCF82881.1 hypothetical protein NITHO_1640009 [Nitrolancea hollandica Lb]